KTILSGAGDKTARLWDVATGLCLGPPLRHGQGVYVVAFSPDGKTFLCGGGDGTARLEKMPASLAGQGGRLSLWLQSVTGLELADGAVRWLDVSAWLDRRQRLEKLGGPPPQPGK